MALNLSTLTNPATSASILNEALTTADLLDSVPILKNLSRGSNKGGDAKQTTALNQPRALPLIKNPSGDLGGYLYIPNVSGNYATGPSVTIGSNQTWEGELDMVVTQWGNYILPMGGGDWTAGFGLIFYSNGSVRMFCKGVSGSPILSGVTLGTPFNVKYGFDGTDVFVDIDGVRKFSETTPSQSTSITHTLQLRQQNNLSSIGNYAIQKAKLTVNNAVVFDCDFNGSTSIRHGDTKFQASVGGPVTINQSGNDPATIIKKSVLRFDGTNSALSGLLNQTLTGGHIFMAYSILGNGGAASQYNRIFSCNSTGSADSSGGGFTLRRDVSSDNLMVRYNAYNISLHDDFFDDERGDYLIDLKVLGGSQQSKVNNADADNGVGTVAGDLSVEEFGVASTGGSIQTALDLEYLAVFPATITDAEADSVRNYINKRNNVFDLKDGFGYYFYDAQKAPVGAITTGSASWNGRIVGSDNGDSDRYLTQGTTNDAPVGDGYVVTFADNTDHLEIPQVTQAGWQVVGTSLGTFAYRVNANAVTELNLLGNLGNASYRQAGDLYGIILLPESATGADIEAARKLLIDRGAADGSSSTSYLAAWLNRSDIVEFTGVNMSGVVNAQNAWDGCTNMVKFGVTDLSNSNNLSYAWYNTSSLTEFPSGANLGTSASNVAFRFSWQLSGLTSFPALDLSKGNDFTSAWRNCSALTSFPSGAKLGTEATNVNFQDAWRASGLTSFSTPLPTATGLGSAFRYCYSLSSFNLDEIPLATHINTAFQGNAITSFNTKLPKVNYAYAAWYACTALTDFSADVFTNWNPSSILTGVFNDTWSGCTSLTAQSVENILVSIDASGKYATTTGASGGSALGDAGIDIDYNVATGSLSAATNAAVTSLKSKGWSIIVNNVTL